MRRRSFISALFGCMAPKTGFGFRKGPCTDSKCWSVLCASAGRAALQSVADRPQGARGFGNCWTGGWSFSAKSVIRRALSTRTDGGVIHDDHVHPAPLLWAYQPAGGFGTTILLTF
ncbi:MAG: hypothetical protein EOR05_12280 [Mesorhizobium sp.]|nr:MAG: hypothetical protein EOR05_12280 [Mesorhizobium sp.]